jgi:DNA-binding transcriptional ArsR family regulator
VIPGDLSIRVDTVFKALADPTRRALLDLLHREDGQSLTALEAGFGMSRFGIAKHLRILEAAGLVVARKEGRERRHYLNTVPIAQIQERWVSKYAAPWAAALVNVKTELERRTMQKVFEIYVKTAPERLWRALTDPAERARYQFGLRFGPAFAEGTEYQAIGHGQLIIDGATLEYDPPRRLVQSYNARWSEEVAACGTSRVTMEIEPIGDSCRLTVIHDDLPDDANPQIFGGWPMILSGLKTLLETGEDLTTPGSLRWGASAGSAG